jgi:GxxExxY protein
MTNNLIYKDEVYQIVGICMEVHRILGHGFSEIVYKDALEYEFKENNISYQREKDYPVEYKGYTLSHRFYADFVVMNKIILELKASQGIDDEHISQTINYLAISKCKLGLIINFGRKSLEYKRLVL